MGLIASSLGIWCVGAPTHGGRPAGRRRACESVSLPHKRGRRRRMKHAIPSHAFSVLLSRRQGVWAREKKGEKKKERVQRPPDPDRHQGLARSYSSLAGPLSRRKDAHARTPALSDLSHTRFDFFAVFRLFPRLLGSLSLSLLPIKSLEMHGKTSRSPCRVTSVGSGGKASEEPWPGRPHGPS